MSTKTYCDSCRKVLDFREIKYVSFPGFKHWDLCKECLVALVYVVENKKLRKMTKGVCKK